MSGELELGMRVDALIVKFLEEEGTTIGCSRWIRKNLGLGELKVLAERRRRMTSPALAKLLGPKPTEPQPIEWMKVRLCAACSAGMRGLRG